MIESNQEFPWCLPDQRDSRRQREGCTTEGRGQQRVMMASAATSTNQRGMITINGALGDNLSQDLCGGETLGWSHRTKGANEA